jgi:hypothetical protein
MRRCKVLVSNLLIVDIVITTKEKAGFLPPYFYLLSRSQFMIPQVCFIGPTQPVLAQPIKVSIAPPFLFSRLEIDFLFRAKFFNALFFMILSFWFIIEQGKKKNNNVVSVIRNRICVF